VTLFPGDGIGPEISAAVETIFSRAAVPIKFEAFEVGPGKGKDGAMIPEEAVMSVRRNRVALKGTVPR